uniref:CNH domain-containing protein n=1 Tax=Angiostrongylus cantonensis TaxID=6313 RepID=A0A0K0CW44_ANGCA
LEDASIPVVQDPSTSELQEENDDDDDGEIDIQIRNVVCNYTLPLHIDLRKLALNSNNVTFDRGRGVLLKQKRKPNCYVKIYSSGKVYIVGCKRSATSWLRAGCRLGSKLRRYWFICYFSVVLYFTLSLLKMLQLAQHYPAQSQYEPELSVGLVWRSQDPKATLRIHTTGSITSLCPLMSYLQVLVACSPCHMQFSLYTVLQQPILTWPCYRALFLKRSREGLIGTRPQHSFFK